MSGRRDITALILYSTDGCHLCEEAEGLLRGARDEGAVVSWDVVDVAGDDALFERYGWHIPVLRSVSGAELAWPFDLPMLRDYLAALSAEA